MKSTIRYLMLAFPCVLLSAGSVVAQPKIVDVCDYEPPESHVTDLLIQGSFTWYDGPYVDDRSRTVAGMLTASFSRLDASPTFGGRIDGRGELRGMDNGWSAALTGAGSVTMSLHDDVFGVAALGLDAGLTSGMELDLTGGIGMGSFRDVTPMANAIRIQNALLDVGGLLAPLPNGDLLELARAVGEIGPGTEEKLSSIADMLAATGLLPDTELDLQGLLIIEEILESEGDARLCGADIQARVGASLTLFAASQLSATGMLIARYAAVPDPVSQWDANAEGRFRIARPEEMNLKASASYDRQLPDGWTARGEYRVTYDRMWSDSSVVSLEHEASATLTTQILGFVGLSLVADLRHQTGDEELTVSLALHLEADLL